MPGYAGVQRTLRRSLLACAVAPLLLAQMQAIIAPGNAGVWCCTVLCAMKTLFWLNSWKVRVLQEVAIPVCFLEED